MKSLLKTALALIPLAVGTTASAQIVNVDASVTGCANFAACSGAHLPAGAFIGDLLSPVQLILGPGTYTITNASLLPGADPQYSAWRFNGADNWVWAFMMINDADKTVIVEGCCGAQVYNSQAAAAADPFAQNFFASFTLATTTTLDFITEDYYPPDNAGGVSLDIEPASKTPISTSAAPEPATLALLFPGVLLMGGMARRRRAAKR
jgi:hypothetical protein